MPAAAGAEGTSLSVSGGPVALGPFVPGIAQSYETTVAATVSAATPGAVLTIADADDAHPGHLVNGTFVLAHPLEARATSAVGAGGAFAPIGGAAAPLTLLTYADPVSDDSAAITLRQSIDANEPLRTGTYAKTLLLTLAVGTA
jgi:hypothetical protein